MNKSHQATDTSFLTDIPARMDRLPFSPMHLLIVAALGITWILDGLEVTLVGSLAAVLKHPDALSLTDAEIGLAGSAYIVGAVGGALLFGSLADRFGRKKLFLVTLAVYAIATILSGLSWDLWSFLFFRVLTGAGIGGEYAAINSAIQEFVPARYRGRTDLIVNGSYWIGAAVGAAGSVVILDPAIVPTAYGWRLAFIGGGVLAFAVIVLRHWVPESPRWLIMHGRVADAEKIAADLERSAVAMGAVPAVDAPKLRFTGRPAVPLKTLIATLIATYPKRTVLCLTLMASQAFCYNAIFFTYALVLTTFYGVKPEDVGWYILPFAVGNFLGPLLLGHLFDTLGRVVMITATYAVSGVLMIATGILFVGGRIDATEQTILWSVNFFFASAGASAAYLTVGESFPLEIRARAISIFYAFGTALGGIIGPALFGVLIASGARAEILIGYAIGGVLMLLGAAAEAVLGIKAECRSLEDVTAPLSARPLD